MNDTLDVKELSKYLKCSESSIRNLVSDNSIPYFRVGVRIFFRKESIDLWIKNQELNNLKQSTNEIMVYPLRKVGSQNELY